MLISVIIGLILFLLLLLSAGTALAGGKYLVQRRQPDPADNPANHGLPYEDVAFISRYNATLRGWWIPANNPRGTVIFSHGHAGSMDADVPMAVFLYQADYNVLMFNFRAHGTSDGDAVTFGVFEKEDLLGAIDFLAAEKCVEKVAVLGMSMGAAVAMITAALTEKIDTLILDGIFERFLTSVRIGVREHGIPAPFDMVITQLIVFGATLLTNTRMYQVSPLLWAKHVHADVAVLFIHAEHEHFASAEGIQRLANDLNGTHKIWIAPRSHHREAFHDHPEAYQAEVLAWLAEHHNKEQRVKP